MPNPIVEEMQALQSFEHEGRSKKDGAPGPGSGRYPLGSGKNPYQHSADFLARVSEVEKSKPEFIDRNGKVHKGDEVALAWALGITDQYGNPSTGRLRVQVTAAKHEERRKLHETVVRLRDQEKMSWQAIADKMGYANDSSIRSLYNQESAKKMNEARNTASYLKSEVDKKGMIDVGVGVERSLNISKDRLKEALYLLEIEGYPTYGGGVPQVTNKGQQTNMKILCKPGTEWKEIYNFENIHYIGNDISRDGGDTFVPKFRYPESMDSKRLKIRYGSEGGKEKDGVIELRRGVPDLSLGESHYSQVRILVDKTHFIKGMAVYGDDKDFPEGVDVIFNTNKEKDVPILGPKDNSILKPIKKDPNNPFGSAIKDAEQGGQYEYKGKDGEMHLGLINKRANEGDWRDWQDKLPSQFLAKQNVTLAKRQLNLDISDKKAEFDEIKSINNPVIKKQLLMDFSENCDSAAVHLKAAALPRQKYQVLLPLTSIGDKEVYAPNFRDGETVALIRYPHGGTFEIPILKVNNKNQEGRKVISATPGDAIGINSRVAERLSGADFDGDAVMVIPCNSGRSTVKITSTDPLKGLEGFDPKLEYKIPPGDTKTKRMKNTQNEMGRISNLITDMTIKGANEEDIAKAVRHSMVVIDAEKHDLDYKRSERDNDIAKLKKQYQGYIDAEGKEHGGASTLLSRAKNEQSVPKRRGSPSIDEKTGELVWKTATDKNLYYIDKKTGKTVMRTQKSTQMAETQDAHALSSGHIIESVYADYANEMKSLANQARLEYIKTPNLVYSKTANKIYKKEVDHLDAELGLALENAPRERQAQAMANAEMRSKKQSNPDMTREEEKKAANQALMRARERVGAQRHSIDISPKEWEAIQAGAISGTKLKDIIKYADSDVLRDYATPKTRKELSSAKIARIKSMKASGFTNEQIAKALGISSSTVSKQLAS